MKNYEKIKKKDYFNKIIATGKIIKTPYFNIFYVKKEKFTPKFGIAVGKKIGTAVKRNKLKRIYRNIIDINKNMFKNNRDYIIIVKEPSVNKKFKELNNLFLKSIKEKENE